MGEWQELDLGLKRGDPDTGKGKAATGKGRLKLSGEWLNPRPESGKLRLGGES